jgi:hypothetical protein
MTATMLRPFDEIVLTGLESSAEAEVAVTTWTTTVPGASECRCLLAAVGRCPTQEDQSH